MQYALVAYDRPNAVARRVELRPQHLAHLEGLGDKLVFAGPFLNDAGEGIGSIVVIEAESLEVARTLFGRDPFLANGLFDTVAIKRWKLSVNKIKP